MEQNNLLNQYQHIFSHCYDIIIIFNYLFYFLLVQQINQKNYKQFLMEIYLNLILYIFIVFIIFQLFNILLIIDVMVYLIIIDQSINLIFYSEVSFFAH